MSSLKSKIESILFVHGEAMELATLSKLLKETPEDLETALGELEEEYKERGLSILQKDSAYQLATNPAHAELIEGLIKSEFSEELSRAAVETIAIIAYKGPLTRAEIEYLRGVNSSFTVRNLLMRGLIERIDNPRDSRSYLYRISFDFLKHFGLSSTEELPQFEEFKKEKIDLPEPPKEDTTNV